MTVAVAFDAETYHAKVKLRTSVNSCYAGIEDRDRC